MQPVEGDISTGVKKLVIHTPSIPQKYYYIKNRSCIMALNGNPDRPDKQLAGTLVVLKEKIVDITIANSQLWYLEDAGDGYCYIVSKQNGLILDSSMGNGDSFNHMAKEFTTYGYC